MQTFEIASLPFLSVSLLATELGMTGVEGRVSVRNPASLPPLFSFAHSSLLNCTFSLRRRTRRRMAKWNAHRKARLISPPRCSRSCYPFVRPARPPSPPLPSLPNDFTALVNTVVRFEPPLAPSPAHRGGVIKSQIAHLSSQLFARNFHVTKAAAAARPATAAQLRRR